MENGVSSCGGRLVRPIIGRFCGYFTSGRSPLSKGSVTMLRANALDEPKPDVPKPVASAAIPARFIISRLSSISNFPREFVDRGRIALSSLRGYWHPRGLSQFVVMYREKKIRRSGLDR